MKKESLFHIDFQGPQNWIFPCKWFQPFHGLRVTHYFSVFIQQTREESDHGGSSQDSLGARPKTGAQHSSDITFHLSKLCQMALTDFKGDQGM